MNSILAGGSKAPGALELFRQAAVTLAKVGESTQAVEILAKGIQSRDAALQKESVQALGGLGADARKLGKELCRLLNSADLIPTVSETLDKVRGPEVVKALAEIVDEGGTPATELAALRILGEMGPDARGAYQAVFRKTKRSKDKEIIEAAKQTLKLIQ
jgi:hypothetical protein